MKSEIIIHYPGRNMIWPSILSWHFENKGSFKEILVVESVGLGIWCYGMQRKVGQMNQVLNLGVLA